MLAMWGVLVAFILAGIFLVGHQLRQDLQMVSMHNHKQANVSRAWYGMEKFFRDTQSCSGFFQGHRLGDTVVGEGFGPIIGREWLNTGLIVKDLYLLKREDEVAWHVRTDKTAQHWNPRVGEGNIYVKVSLVARPDEGGMGIDYLLNTPGISRIFQVKVTMARELILSNCDAHKTQQACQQAALEVGSLAQIRPSRAPASLGMKCEGREPHTVQCLLPGDRFPIYKCL